jgi:hypothetical protein
VFENLDLGKVLYVVLGIVFIASGISVLLIPVIVGTDVFGRYAVIGEMSRSDGLTRHLVIELWAVSLIVQGIFQLMRKGRSPGVALCSTILWLLMLSYSGQGLQTSVLSQWASGPGRIFLLLVVPGLLFFTNITSHLIDSHDLRFWRAK